jgi:hypothetical protein
MKRRRRATFTAVLAALVLVDVASAKSVMARLVAPPRVGPGGTVNLPYFTQDARGNQWRVYQGGWIQQQGGQTLYSQGAQLTINGGAPNQNTNQGKLDEKTGELILENLTGNGFTVTRRILVDKEQGYVRYIDIIKNTGAQPAQAQIQIQTNFNYSMNATQTVSDPKRKGQEIAWIAQTGAGPSVMEIFAGKGAKSVFNITGPAQNSYVQSMMTQMIPAGKEIAVMHLHGIVPTPDAGVQFVRSMKESQILRTIPREVRKIIINFVGGQNFIGDVEILRGDLLDVVELKGGDQYRGTLKEPSFPLETFYGKVDLPVEQVIGVINVGRFRPRQLIVTTDGQIFGGKLAKETIDLELSSKQVIKVPISQVVRVGYRKRSGEPEEWTFDKPMVLMRTGERVCVRMPTEPISVVTRYGKLSIKPETVAAEMLQTEEHGVHEIRLNDGSKFAGLLDANTFTMKLDNTAGQTVTFPASSVARLQFTNKVPEVDDSSGVATLSLANDDVLVGTLGGKLVIDTAFDTIPVNAEEIKALAHPTPGSLDVSLTLWDGTTLSGQLQDQDLACTLASGLAVKVPVALVQEYEQPAPAPSSAMKERIKTIIADLNATDWKQRDRAEAALVGMGPVAIGVLKELRSGQPPEAQQRIDSVVKELETQREREKSSGGGGGTAPKAAVPPSPSPAPPLELPINVQITD